MRRTPLFFSDAPGPSPAAERAAISRTTPRRWATIAATAPVIYSLALPLVALDVWVSLYQWTCFPLYGIPRVPRRPYLVMDRHRLPYLTRLERLHCAYCAYANGVMAYVREVAACTEHYWCPIKHATTVADPHDHYELFFDYGNAVDYHRGLPRLRRRLSAHVAPHRHVAAAARTAARKERHHG